MWAARRPEAVLDWLVDIVDTPTTLDAWATHLAGLLGDDLGITGDGTPRIANPFEVDPFWLPTAATGGGPGGGGPGGVRRFAATALDQSKLVDSP